MDASSFPDVLPRTISLERPATLRPWAEMIPDPTLPNPIEVIFQQEVSRLLTQLLDTRLTEREAVVLKLRFGFSTDHGEGLTLVEAAEVVGVSRERIRQIENTALNKLRDKPQIIRALKSLL